MAIDEWEDAHAQPVGQRRGVVAEVVGYAGVVLAASAAWLALAQYWADVETWARVLLVATGTTFAAGAGWTISSAGDVALRRLAALLWAAAVLGAGVTCMLVGGEVIGFADQNVLLLTGTVTTAAGAALLWWRRATLQSLAFLAATVLLVLGIVSQYDHVSSDTIGTALWGLGACWTLLALSDIVPTPRPALVAGPAVALVGAWVMTDDWTQGRWIGLASALALLVGAGFLRAPGLAVVGLPGLFVFIGDLVAAMTTDQGEPQGAGVGLVLGLVVVGLGLLAGAVVVARHQGLEGGRDAR